MKISLGSWAFSFGPYADHPIPFEAIVKRLSEAGYDGIEIGGFPPQVTLERYRSKESRRELVQFLADHRLAVSGYAADLTSVNPLVRNNQQKYLELFERNVDLCAALGSPRIRIDSVAAPGSIAEADYAAALRHLTDTWRCAAEYAATAGVQVAWEFEPGFLFNKPSEILSLHERVGHPNFRILFDTSHAHMCGMMSARQHGSKERIPGGVLEFLQRLRGRIGHIHLVDSDGTLHADETSTHRPLGDGVIDFRTLAPHLLSLAGVEWWCVDLCFWPDAWELVEQSLEFVEALLDPKLAAWREGTLPYSRGSESG